MNKLSAISLQQSVVFLPQIYVDSGAVFKFINATAWKVKTF